MADPNFTTDFNRPMREVQRKQIILHQEHPFYEKMLNRKYSYTETQGNKPVDRSKV